MTCTAPSEVWRGASSCISYASLDRLFLLFAWLGWKIGGQGWRKDRMKNSGGIGLLGSVAGSGVVVEGGV